MNILSLCGSRRLNSSNMLLLRAAQNYLQPSVWNQIDAGTLPYFDPDNQFEGHVPTDVIAMRRLAAQSDVILISTPEYAHGIPGILKNALEWLFSEETQKKPCFVMIGSAQGEWARDQLLEVLRTMDFTVSDEHFILIKSARTKIDGNAVFSNPTVKTDFESFCQKIKTVR